MALKFEIKDRTVTITECDPKLTGDLIIPSAINNHPVTSIDQGAFYGCTRLTSVTIPSSITKIGGWAFPKHTVITRETV